MKAVLILDMPSCCNNCPCFDGMEDRSDCKYLEKNIEDILIIDKDCPLKPLPQEKVIISIPEKASPIEFNGHICYAKGWNDCIDKLLGEDK